MDREPGCPPAQGLYDPSHEKDACGVGFVVNVKGVRSHAIVKPGAAAARQPAASRRVRLRGEHRRRRRHPDSDAGQVSAQGGAQSRHHAAAGGRVRRGLRLPAARLRRRAPPSRRSIETDRPGGRADAARLARSADRRSPGRRVGGGGRAVLQADVRRAGSGTRRSRDEPIAVPLSSASSTSSASASSTRSTSCRSRAPTRSTSTSRACRRTR